MKPAIVASVLCILLAGTAGSADLEKTHTLVRGNTAFALQLYRSLSGQGTNTCISPFSVSTTLAMVYAAAKGGTAEQFTRVLAAGQEPALFHKTFAELRARLYTECKQDQCMLTAANAVWVRKSQPLLQSYSDVLKMYYGADATEVDFATDPEAARKRINSWVERHTAYKITELLAKGSVDPATRIVLTNAVYFKGKWALQFDKDETADAPFTLFDGSSIVVPTMHVTGEFRFVENGGFQAVELPYGDDKFSMVILLPRSHDELREFEASLTPEALVKGLNSMSPQDIRVSLPRFTVRFHASLTQHLKAMGLADAFSAPPADFSGMDGSKDLFISEVAHEVFIDVNEEGSEAAAATGTSLMTTAIKQVKEFTADHPFLFFIRHRDSGLILFLGCVLHPLR